MRLKGLSKYIDTPILWNSKKSFSSKYRITLFKIISLICVMLLLNNVCFANNKTQMYKNKYKHLCDSLSAIYHIPSGVILSISLLESSIGEGKSAIRLNNFFGIEGRNNLYKTHKIKSRYKQYNNAKESFIDFCNLMTRKKYYSKLKTNNNCVEWIKTISENNYSEQPAIWYKRVTQIISSLKLC
jgi:flagellum-specific peptidoglycan hydrolase FlgJ